MACGVLEEVCDGAGKPFIFNDITCVGTDDVAGSTVRGDDGGDAGGEGFEDDVAEGVGVGGEDEQIHVAVGLGEGFAAENAGKDGVRKLLMQLGFEASLTDDEKAGVDDAGVSEGGLDSGEERHVLFDRQTAYKAQKKRVFVGVERGFVEVKGCLEQVSRPSRRSEEVGVDTALHEVAGAIAETLEEGAEIRVGSEEDAG